MSLSLITPVRGRLDHLERLVRGLAECPDRPDEFIVARMGGEDPRPVLEESPVSTEVIEIEGAELPLAKARNRGAEVARAENLVFLDVDCVPRAGLFGAYEAALAETDGIVIGRTLYELDPPGTGYRIPHAGHFERAVDVGTDYAEFWSLNFAIRRETFWGALRGFDETFAGYGIEDTDFARDAETLGLPLVWVRDATVVHLHHPPSRFDRRRIPALVSNVKRFRDKWGSWPAQGWLDELADRGLVEWEPDRERLEPA